MIYIVGLFVFFFFFYKIVNFELSLVDSSKLGMFYLALTWASNQFFFTFILSQILINWTLNSSDYFWWYVTKFSYESENKS